MPYESYRYKLRAGTPVPSGAVGSPDFVLQTFMAEKVKILVDEAKAATEILKTEDFRGQGGHFLQASYQRLPYKTTDGAQVFSSTEETYPDGPEGRSGPTSTYSDWDTIYIDEDEIPGS